MKPISSHAALQFGLEAEKVACALEDDDMPMLEAIAGRLSAVAINQGAAQIGALAARIRDSAATGHDLVELARLTTNLLELCRSAGESCLSRRAGEAVA